MGVTESIVEPNQENEDRAELGEGEKKHGDFNTNFRPSMLPSRKHTEFDSLASDVFPRISGPNTSNSKGQERDSVVGLLSNLKQTPSK